MVLGLNTGDPAWLRREIEIAQETERRRASSYRVIPHCCPALTSPSSITGLPSATANRPGLIVHRRAGRDAGLLTALGELLPSETATDRTRPPPVELELTFSQSSPPAPDAWRLAARLNHHPLRTPTIVSTNVGSATPATRSTHSALVPTDHLCWPIDTVRQLARHVDTCLASWGHPLIRPLSVRRTCGTW